MTLRGAKPDRPFREFRPISILQGFPERFSAPIGLAPMPKQKTHKGTKKRFRVTASGKVKHRGAGTSHLASRKSKKRRRKLRRTRVLSKTMVHQIVEAVAGHSS